MATVIRLSGQSWELLIIAARQRSRASATQGSGSPVRDHPGTPLEMSASMVTTRPVTPSSATEYVIPVAISGHADDVVDREAAAAGPHDGDDINA